MTTLIELITCRTTNELTNDNFSVFVHQLLIIRLTVIIII